MNDTISRVDLYRYEDRYTISALTTGCPVFKDFVNDTEWTLSFGTNDIGCLAFNFVVNDTTSRVDLNPY